MKNEKELNTIIKNSLSWGFKISDPPKVAIHSFQKNCFDGFGILETRPVYWEAKFLKNLESFNLNSIADHQINNLSIIKKLMPDAFCWIVLGIRVGRNDSRIYLFDNIEEISKRRLEKKNYLRKELDEIPFFRIKKNRFIITNYKSTT
jgi:penicillin-binding protein-related factor A (putative recombinase)